MDDQALTAKDWLDLKDWLDRAVKLLANNLEAWESETDEIQAEHQGLIKKLSVFFAEYGEAIF